MSEHVTIEQADNQAIADLIKQRLDQAGIPCLLLPSDMAAVAGAGASYAGTVPAERADEATEPLGDRPQPAPDAPALAEQRLERLLPVARSDSDRDRARAALYRAGAAPDGHVAWPGGYACSPSNTIRPLMTVMSTVAAAMQSSGSSNRFSRTTVRSA